MDKLAEHVEKANIKTLTQPELEKLRTELKMVRKECFKEYPAKDQGFGGGKRKAKAKKKKKQFGFVPQKGRSGRRKRGRNQRHKNFGHKAVHKHLH